MGEIWLFAVGLALILEGLLPFAFPHLWRDLFRRVSELGDGQIRFIGLTSLLIGLGLILVSELI